MNNTFMANPDKVERKWYVVDATGYTLGRLSSEIAKILRGKNKAVFTPHIDTGDYVIVVNAEKIKVTGKKLDQKIYYHHSDYVGGMKETTLKEMLDKHPERVIEYAVKGMLPKGPLGRQMYKKLFVYAGPDHKHKIAAHPRQAHGTGERAGARLRPAPSHGGARLSIRGGKRAGDLPGQKVPAQRHHRLVRGRRHLL